MDQYKLVHPHEQYTVLDQLDMPLREAFRSDMEQGGALYVSTATAMCQAVKVSRIVG